MSGALLFPFTWIISAWTIAESKLLCYSIEVFSGNLNSFLSLAIFRHCFPVLASFKTHLHLFIHLLVCVYVWGWYCAMVCLCELSRPIVGLSSVGSGIDLRLLGLYGKGTCLLNHLASTVVLSFSKCLYGTLPFEYPANILIQHHKTDDDSLLFP